MVKTATNTKQHNNKLGDSSKYPNDLTCLQLGETDLEHNSTETRSGEGFHAASGIVGQDDTRTYGAYTHEDKYHNILYRISQDGREQPNAKPRNTHRIAHRNRYTQKSFCE